jgi:hypothetical protein
VPITRFERLVRSNTDLRFGVYVNSYNSSLNVMQMSATIGGGHHMEVAAAMALGKSLIEIGKGLGELIEKAHNNNNVPERVIYYLQTAQSAVQALGIERQRILTEARCCDLSNKDEVTALFKRIDCYLYQDNVRRHLQAAMDGLRACEARLTSQGDSAWWRKSDKAAAVKQFVTTLSVLQQELKALSSDFYPGGGSGMGVATLKPIYGLIEKAKDRISAEESSDFSLDDLTEKLSDLLSTAVTDSSNEEWIRSGGKVEALVAELELAFSVRVAREARSH